MSCDAYIGLPRSGKSLSMLQAIIAELKNRNGRNVHTNLPINLNLLALIHDVDVSRITLWDGKEGRPDSIAFAATFGLPDFIKDVPAVPDGLKTAAEKTRYIETEVGRLRTEWEQKVAYYQDEEKRDPIYNHVGSIHDKCLVVYDEIHLQFSTITARSNIYREGMCLWVSMYGHYGCDFIWASQAYESVDVDIRRRTNYYLYCKSNERKIKGKGTFTKQLLPKTEDTHEPNFKFSYKTDIIKVEPKYYRCYQSFDIAGSDNLATNGFKLPPVVKKYGIILIIAVLAFIGTAYFAASKIGGSKKSLSIKAPPANGQTKSKTDTTKGGKNVQSFSDDKPIVLVDGIVCVGNSCDGYQNGEYIGTYIDKDTSEVKHTQYLAGGH